MRKLKLATVQALHNTTVLSQTILSSVHILISVSEFFVITSGEELSSSCKDPNFGEQIKMNYEF